MIQRDSFQKLLTNKVFWLHLFMMFSVLLYAGWVLSSYTTLHQSQFCFDKCTSDNASQSLSYVPKTITVDLTQSQTKLGKDELLLAKSENAVLSVDKVVLNDQQVKYQLRNISQDTTVLVDDTVLPRLNLADYREPRLKIGNNILTFVKTHEPNHDLVVNVKKENNDTVVNYYLKQGRIIAFDDGSGQVSPNCQHDGGVMRSLVKGLHDANNGYRSVSFGGLMVCDYKIPIAGIQGDVLMLRYQKADNDYHIRPMNGNMEALHNHVIKYQDSGDNSWQNFKEKPFELTPNQDYAIKMGYSEFGRMTLNGEQLIFEATDDNIRQKISKNHLMPTHIHVQDTSLIDIGLAGIVMSVLLIAFLGFVFHYCKNDDKTNIRWIEKVLIGSLLAMPLLVILLLPILQEIGILNILLFSDLAWVAFTLMILVLAMSLYLAFFKYQTDNQKNTQYIMMLFSLSVVTLLVINIDYGSALNIADASNKYFQDFKTQLKYICVFLYFWLVLLVFPLSWAKCIFEFLINLLSQTKLIFKDLKDWIYKEIQKSKLWKTLYKKYNKYLWIIVGFIPVIIVGGWLVYYVANYVNSHQGILNINKLMVCLIFIALSAFVLVSIMLDYCAKKIGKYLARENTQNDNKSDENTQSYFGKLFGLSLVLGTLLFVQAFFGTETGVGGIFQPNELMKFALCLLISWLVISAKKSELEIIMLIAVIASMVVILLFLNDYSYAFFILFLVIGGMLSFFYRRMFWSINYEEDMRHYTKIITKLKECWLGWNIVLKSLPFVALIVVVGLFLVYVYPNIVIPNRTSMVILIVLLVFFRIMHCYLYKKHRPHHEKDKLQLNNRLKNVLVIGFGLYFLLGIFAILLVMFCLIPSVPLMNEGNTAERLSVWQSLLLHKETGHQLLQAYHLQFDNQAMQNFIKVPEIDDDFAYTGWLYGETVGAVSLLWFAVIGYAGSLLWFVKEVGVAPYFNAINIKNSQNWNKNDLFEIVSVACKYKYHSLSASTFVICALSVFMVHVVLSVSTNLNFLPVVGQPFPYLGRQGSHLILFEFLVVLVVIYFLRRHFVNNHDSVIEMRHPHMHPVDNVGVFVSVLPPDGDEHKDIEWKFPSKKNDRKLHGAKSVRFYSNNSMAKHIDKGRLGYAVSEVQGYSDFSEKDIKVSVTQVDDPNEAGVFMLAELNDVVQVNCSQIEHEDGNKEQAVLITPNDKNDKKPFLIVSSPLPLPRPNAPQENDVFRRFLSDVHQYDDKVCVERRALTCDGQYPDPTPLHVSKVPKLEYDNISLARWYATWLNEDPDEFVLYMKDDKAKQEQVGELLRKYLFESEQGNYWQLGHLKISGAEQADGQTYDLQGLRIEITIVVEGK